MTDPSPERRPVLVTGAAGFIGFHVARALLEAGTPVIGVDSMNAYYDPRLKEARLRELEGRAGFAFQAQDLADRAADRGAVCRGSAGSRPPHGGPGGGALLARRSARLHGRQYRRLPERAGGVPPQRRRASDLRVLELGLRGQHGDAVLGARQRRPSREPLRRQQEGQRADGPLLQPPLRRCRPPACASSRCTGRGGGRTWRFSCFTKAILEGRPIQVFNEGRMRRDFTYIDDVVEGVLRASERVPAPNPQWDGGHPDPGSSTAPYRLYNIGNSEPVDLMHVIATLEAALGRKAQLELLPMQPGDVAGDLCRRGGPRARRGLQAGDADRGGDCALRGVVPGVLRGLTLLPDSWIAPLVQHRHNSDPGLARQKIDGIGKAPDERTPEITVQPPSAEKRRPPL